MLLLGVQGATLYALGKPRLEGHCTVHIAPTFSRPSLHALGGPH